MADMFGVPDLGRFNVSYLSQFERIHFYI